MSAVDAVTVADELASLLSCSSALEDPDTAERVLRLVAAMKAAAEAAERTARRKDAALRELAAVETRRRAGLKRFTIPQEQRDAERLAVADILQQLRAGRMQRVPKSPQMVPRQWLSQLTTAKYIAGKLKLPLRRVRGYMLEIKQATRSGWPKQQAD